MMKVDKNNYRELALDYIEGTMDGALRGEFEKFLAADGEAYDEVCSLTEDMPVLTPPSETYPDKGRLIRKTFLGRVAPYAAGMAAAAVLVAVLMWVGTTEPQKLDAVIGVAETVNSNGKEEISAHSTPDAITDGAVAATPVKPEDFRAERQPAAVKNVSQDNAGIIDAPKTRTSGTVSDVTSRPEREDMPEYYEPPVLAQVAIPEIPEEMLYGNKVGLPAQAQRPEIRLAQRYAAEEAYPNSDYTDEYGQGLELGIGMRKTFSFMMASLDDITPITKFETNEEKGIEIASLIRIKKQKN